MADELANEMKSIKQACEELSLARVPGSFEREKMPVVQWNSKDESEYRAFLTLAKNLGCTFVVVEESQFNEEVIDYLKPEEREETDEAEDGKLDKGLINFETQWGELKEKYKKYYDSVFAFGLHWFREGVCHSYEREASWYRELVEDAEKLKVMLEAAVAESEEDEIPELTGKEIEDVASVLARDELFQQATNQGARRFALKKRFPKIVEDHEYQISEIINQAKALFELEIKPELETALDTQIVELSKEGLSKDEIAKKLRTSSARVKRAL